MRIVLLLASCCLIVSCTTGTQQPAFDWIIRGGTVYDGTGGDPRQLDIGIKGDRIERIALHISDSATSEIDASGLAVSPGFINMLSWATESLLEDGRAQSDIRQGVTLEVFGEGVSMGPLNEEMKEDMRRHQGDIRFEIAWTTLSEYLEHLVRRGIAPNVASFVGATTVRVHVLGYEDRQATAEELETMKGLVRQAMEEGALGVGSSLIYAPAFYASTEELIELCKVAAEYGGMYISHIRSEGNQLLEEVDELITIARRANIPAEIYHLKASGESNWPKLDQVIEKIEQARSEGLRITADMYNYTAGATGLDAAMPPWVQEGGLEAWIERLRDAETRNRVAREMREPAGQWENLYLAAGSPEKVLLVSFKNPELKHLTGKSLAEVAEMRGTSPEETAMDLVVEDGSRVGTVYFLMSEENLRQKVALRWVSFGSDASAPSTEGVFLKSNPHPRAYGNFARLLARYVRQEQVIPLQEAIRRMTSLPALNLGIEERGILKKGNYADIVIFDPETIQDHSTYADPHKYATGVSHVFVNGLQVLRDGEPTGVPAGRVVRGPGSKMVAGDR